MKIMKRRNFIKDMAVGGMMLNLPRGLLAQANPGPLLAQVTGEDPALITKAAVNILGGMSKFVAKGEKVLVKPNIGWDRTPELGACTNPEVVKALVEMCIEAIPLNGELLKEWEIYSDFIEADKIINVPATKHHSLSRVTLGMKNWLGACGGNRNQMHQGLDQSMVDLAAFFKPALTVLDAYRVLFRNGPQGGRLSDVKEHKTVVAGVDYVAVDALGATFLDVDPSELRFLQIARARGLGEPDLEKVTIEKRTL